MRSTGCAANSAPMSNRSRTASPRWAGRARAACRSSCCGSIPAGQHLQTLRRREFPFSRFGGTCPRWNLHAAFQAAGQVVTPDHRDPRRAAIFHRSPDDRAADQDRAWRRSCSRSASAATSSTRTRSLAPTGYDLDNAPATPVGPACAICPRIECAYRATPPAGRMLAVDTRPQDDLALPVRRQPRARPASRSRARRGPNARGRRRRRRSTGGSRRAWRPGRCDARTSA